MEQNEVTPKVGTEFTIEGFRNVITEITETHAMTDVYNKRGQLCMGKDKYSLRYLDRLFNPHKYISATNL